MLVYCGLWYAVERVDVPCKFLTRPITLSGGWFVSDPRWIQRCAGTVLLVYVGDTDCGCHNSEPNVAKVVYIARRKHTKTVLCFYNIFMFSLKNGLRERN